MRSLYNCVITTLFLLALFRFGEDAYAGQPLAPTTTQLRQVIEAHYRAIEDNQLDRAMAYYHSLSPDRTQTRETIELGLTQFLLKTATLDFCFDGQQGQFALATAQHKYLRISGIKFTVENVNVAYQLRAEQGNWKIWRRREYPSNTATLSNCDRVGNAIWVTL